MTIIHMDTDTARYTAGAMNQAVDRMLDLENQLKRARGQLLDAWQAGNKSKNFLREYKSLLKAYAELVEELELLSLALTREVDEWVEVDNNRYGFGISAGKAGAGEWTLDKGMHFEKKKGDIFKKGKGDAHAIEYDDIKQGQFGTCYLLASLSAIAMSDPSIIENMIKQEADGSYTVTFWDNGNPVPINVDNYFPGEDGTLCFDGEVTSTVSKDKGELWPSLIEKAYAKWKGGYEAIEYDWPAMALEDLTGKSVTENYLGMTPTPAQQAQNMAEMQNALANNEPVVIGMEPGFDGVGGYHALTVTKIEGGQVSLYNPWGRDVVVSEADFWNSCYYVSYVTP